jgi:NitT/TauT family transport system substrate-binding protein
MTRIIKGFMTFVSVALLMTSAMTAAQADKIRIALAETPSDELAAFFCGP